MALTKLTSTEAFIVTDVPEANASGVVRMGKKILQSSAKDLARSATYSFAAFGIQRGGASAGINAEGDAKAAALAAFVAEARPSQDIHLFAGKGVGSDDLQGLGGPALAGSRSLTVSGVVAAARWACSGDLAGRTAAVEGHGVNPLADLVAAGLADAGATVIAADPDAKPWEIWGTEADLLLAGTKPGTLTHQGAAMVKAKHVVPWAPIPVTTKAYLMLERAGTTLLPDFVTASGGLVAAYLDGASSDAAELAVQLGSQITEVLEATSQHSDGPLMGACISSEAFLETWTDWTPFGRPLAA